MKYRCATCVDHFAYDTEMPCVFCKGTDWRPAHEAPTYVGQRPPVPGGRKYDAGKLLFSLIPPQVTTELAKILTYGAAKYEPNNWQNVQPFKQRYTDALFRHIEAWRGGQERDAESGHLHLSHALCCVAFLVWDAVVRPAEDARPDGVGAAEVPRPRSDGDRAPSVEQGLSWIVPPR